MKKIILSCAFLLSALLAGCGSFSSDSLSGPSLTLDEKLVREYKRYDAAKELVQMRYKPDYAPLDKKMIARNDWEATLAPRPGENFTEFDLQTLRERQQNTIAAARTKAIKASRVDFSRWRALPVPQKKKKIDAFCKAAPKGGMLHIHPWGTLHPTTYAKLMKRSNPVIPVERLHARLSQPDALAYLYPDEAAWLATLPANTRFLSLPQADQGRLVALSALPSGTHPFERFEAVFNFVALVMIGDWQNINIAYDDFAKRAVQAGVQYVEFTEAIAPADVPHYDAIARRLKAKYGLTVRFNVAYFRTHSATSQHQAVKVMLEKVHSPFIVGIDLLASEKNAPSLETAQGVYGPVMAYNAKGKTPWRRTMHAGEHGDPRNTRDALLLGAERLGHGVRLIENPVVLQYAVDHKIPVEINLISNLKLQALKDIRQHPYLTYLRLGLPVSLSTDDEGIYETDIRDECKLAVGETDLTYDEFKQMAFNSIRTSFASEKIKQQQLRNLTLRFNRFEKTLSPAAPLH